MKRLVLILSAALLALPGATGWAGAAEEATHTYDVAMTAEEEAPVPGPSGATGHISLSIDPASGQLCYWDLTYDGPGKVDQGHIHKGPKGMAGPVVVSLGMPEEGKKVCVDADGETLQSIADDPAGHYVNLHTPEYPAGAVRGQVG